MSSDTNAFQCLSRKHDVTDPVNLATGRPCVPAFVDSGTMPAFTCDCLHL